MNHEITHGPSCAMLRVDLQPGEALVAEAGAMVARSKSIGMEVKMNAGKSPGFFATLMALLVAFIRKIIGGETFFVNHFAGSGSVWIAPTLIGEVAHRRLDGNTTLVLSSGAYVASAGDIDVKMRFGGLSGMLAKEGLFFLEITGTGDLWFNSYGGIEEVACNGSYVVDNGHIVGYEGQLTYKMKSVGGGMMGMMASGEGLVCHFSGEGKIYIQSRNTSSLAGFVNPFLS